MTSISELALNKALEWDRFIELAQAEARTEPGKSRIESLRNAASWAPDLETSRALQQETLEITPLLDRDALWGPLLELPDPSDPILRLSQHAVLQVEDLVVLRRWLYAIDSWVQIPREEIRGEKFRRALSQFSDPFNMLRVLEKVLTPDGEISERASPKLATLYSEIRSLRREISQVLDQLMASFSQRGILQEKFTDVRDGRYVIPVKISSQNEIDGNIYEASVSRQTVFVEPREVAALNNRLRQRQNDLVQEIFIVLEETSRRIQPFVPEIQTAVTTLTYWDAVQAKARLGLHYSGKSIQVSEDRQFILKQSAHPLLWWSLPAESIIRNEIEFGPSAKTLLITGPNTGGKTVLLKTLGLAGICARTGFPFPAIDRPLIPFFDSFFADLGDPQSIEHHLSSFSGHVLRLKEILEKITDRSLVLIDELNSATDPDEGAAFGRATLEFMMSKDAMIITTTHDPHLKALAVSDTRILNSSMAFDENSKTPTYKMIQGTPGRSRALETAERLGIPLAVIQIAKGYLSQQHLEFEQLLAKLESDTQEATRARKEAVLIREEAERLKKEWTTRTESSVNEMMDRTRLRLKRIVEQAQDEVRSSVRKLDEMKSRKEIFDTRTHLTETLNQAVSQLDSAVQEEAPILAEVIQRKETSAPSTRSPSSEDSLKLEVGGSVRVPKWKSVGTVLEIAGSKVKVALGTLQMTLSTNEIQPIAPSSTKSSMGRTHFAKLPDAPVPAAEIDLRGARFDEAMSNLEHYLDQAFRSGSLREITVVHGLGTGALREGTLKLLSELPYVKSFRSGGAGHGGTGATIVEFDRD